MKITIPQDVKVIAHIFKNHGYQCFVVGGAVRDSILKRHPEDWDLATDALPLDIVKLFKAVIPTGIEHGTVTIRWKGKSYETTTFRIEKEYSDARHPDTVLFTNSLHEDLARRDFTINSLAADPFSGSVIDYFDGIKDLKSRIIRAVGNPEERFNEDALRTLRAIRFAGVLQFSIEPSTYSAIKTALSNIPKLSIERIREEFSKLMLSPKPSYPLLMLEETGLMKFIIPEYLACKNITQGSMHRYDVSRHLLASCDAAPGNLIARLAALLHDIAKPLCRVEKNNELTFYGHDKASAEMAKIILTRLKYPNHVIEKICIIIENHMVFYNDFWTDGAVKRFIRRLGIENLENFFMLKVADAAGMSGCAPDIRTVKHFYDRVYKIIHEKHALSLKDLAVNGNDLIALGYKKGPVVGKVLQELLETVLDDPSVNTRERLLSIATLLRDKYTSDQ